MKISVIIPTHNRVDLLERAIKSVLNQTLEDIEIIVVDDASSISTKNFINSFNGSIIYHRFETNQGANVCRNKGVSLSSFSFIAFLDDDDTWEVNKLEKQFNLMNSRNIDLCYTGKNIIYMDENLRIEKQRYSFANPKNNNLSNSIMKSNFIGTTSSIMLRKSKFLEIGGFDIVMPSLQDYEFYIRFISCNFSVEGINEPLVNYYIYKGEAAISKSLKKGLKSSIILFKKNKKVSLFVKLLISLVKMNLKKIL